MNLPLRTTAEFVNDFKYHNPQYEYSSPAGSGVTPDRRAANMAATVAQSNGTLKIENGMVVPNTPASVTGAPVVSPTIGTSRTPGLLDDAKREAAQAAAGMASARAQAEGYAAQQRQMRIDAINSVFAPRIQREQQQGDARLSRVAALNFKSGITGSGVDTTKTKEQTDLNEKSLKAIEDEKNIAIAEAFGKADELARQRAEDIYKEKTTAANANVDLYKDRADKANETLKLFASQGITADQLKSVDPKTYETLRDVSGMSDSEINAFLKVNAPAGTYQWNAAQVNGSTMYVPKLVNGKVTMEKVDLGFTPKKEVKEVVKTDSGVMIVHTDGTHEFVGTGGGGDTWGTISNDDKTNIVNFIQTSGDLTAQEKTDLLNSAKSDRAVQARILQKVKEQNAGIYNPFK